MHEVFKIKSSKPIPKISQKPINFEKPQNFSKSPKPSFQNMKCMKNERLEAYQVKKLLKKLEETLRRRLAVRWECLGDEEIEISRERSREIRIGSHRT